MISAFSFAHNAIKGGYPIKEAVAAIRPYVDEVVLVDLDSTDGTTELLNQLGDKVLQGKWDGPDTTPNAFLQHVECSGNTIVFFEADEVFDDSLIRAIRSYIDQGSNNLAVWRLQISQNFQRCRWYPIPVHRIFPRGGGTYHIHPTQIPKQARNPIYVVPNTYGFLWDVSNCFRDNWFDRKIGQQKVWGEPRSLLVREHFTHPVEVSAEEELALLQEDHWTWDNTPFNIPAILRPLVGKTKYEV